MNLQCNLKFLLVALACALSACGGGGGGSETSSPTSTQPIDPNLTVPFQTAIANLVNNGVNKSFSLTGFVDNSTDNTPLPRIAITGTGTLTIGAPVSSTFNGNSVLRTTQVVTGAATANTQNIPLAATATVYYNTGTYTVAGTVNGTTTLIYAPYTNPSTVKAGNTGSLGTGSTRGLFETTSTSAYSVATDTATSLLVTVIDTVKEFGGNTTTTQSVYRVSTSGSVILVSIDVVANFLGKDYKRLTYTF